MKIFNKHWKKVSELKPEQSFQWTSNAGFGGYFVKNNDDGTTLVMDSGCDGNHYTERILSSNKQVYVPND